MLRIWIALLSPRALPVCRNMDIAEREKASRKVSYMFLIIDNAIASVPHSIGMAFSVCVLGYVFLWFYEKATGKSKAYGAYRFVSRCLIGSRRLTVRSLRLARRATRAYYAHR